MSSAHETPVGGAAGTLSAVDGLLADGGGRAGRRAAVRVLRVALERAVDDAWSAAGRPELAAVSRRAQFLTLGCAEPPVVDPQAARAAGAVWSALSAACHHHAYELTPTAAEVADLRARTSACLAVLAAGHPNGQPAPPPWAH